MQNGINLVSFIQILGKKVSQHEKLFNREKANLAATELVYQMMIEKDVSRKQMANKLGISVKAFNDLIDGKTDITVRMLSDMLLIFNKTLQINMC